MKIVFFEVKERWEKELIRKTFKKDKVLIFEETLQDADLKQTRDADAVSVFIYSKATKDVLSKFPKLKMIATRSTGFDHVDLKYCKSKRIVVCNVPHYGENTVAEFTFGLILTVSRRIYTSIKRVKSGVFDFSGLRGFDLAGKILGIVGFGNIGQRVAKIAKGFNMGVVCYDPNSKIKAVSDKGKSLGVRFVSLDELYKVSDIISLHVPLTSKTRHMINKKSIDKMKKGVVIINTARGDIIDSKALLGALNSGKIECAGLDVLEGEAMIKDELELICDRKKGGCKVDVLLQDHILMNHPKVIATPHNAFNTIDALKRILNTTLDNLKGFATGKIETGNRVV